METEFRQGRFANLIGNMSSNTTNDTVTADDPYSNLWGKRSEHVLAVIGFLLIVIIIGTIFGNALVILSPLKNRRLQTVSNYYIISLAVADLLVGIAVLPFSAIYELRRVWDFGPFFCNIYVSCDVMFCTASMLSLFAISIDRYMAITDPMTYHVKMTSGRALTFIGVVWLVSFLISFVPLHLGWNTEDGNVQNYATPTQCAFEHNPTYSLVDGIVLFFIPLIVMCVTYLRVLMIARQQARKINAGAITQRRESVILKSKSAVDEHKATKILAVVMGCFVICWVPYFLAFTFCPLGKCNVSYDAFALLLWLGYVNSTINPILYALLNREFRKAFRRLTCCCRKEQRERPSWASASDSSENTRKRNPTSTGPSVIDGTISMTDRA
uniref:Histamine H2 receptor-like n=1 Tax=Saccoglossus kowalevskii TaxID=10224 RepID=A0ABM0MS40_SACKO|nr:PREDICTED: histamine H2 receptor-like [Saccoglossus kowalevskii]